MRHINYLFILSLWNFFFKVEWDLWKTHKHVVSCCFLSWVSFVELLLL